MYDHSKALSKDGPNVARARYLEAAYDLIRAKLLPEAPERSKVALAYSFPSRRIRKTLGQCHYLDKAHKKQIVQHLRRRLRATMNDIEYTAICLFAGSVYGIYLRRGKTGNLNLEKIRDLFTGMTTVSQAFWRDRAVVFMRAMNEGRS